MKIWAHKLWLIIVTFATSISEIFLHQGNKKDWLVVIRVTSSRKNHFLQQVPLPSLETKVVAFFLACCKTAESAVIAARNSSNICSVRNLNCNDHIKKNKTRAWNKCYFRFRNIFAISLLHIFHMFHRLWGFFAALKVGLGYFSSSDKYLRLKIFCPSLTFFVGFHNFQFFAQVQGSML